VLIAHADFTQQAWVHQAVPAAMRGSLVRKLALLIVSSNARSERFQRTQEIVFVTAVPQGVTKRAPARNIVQAVMLVNTRRAFVPHRYLYAKHACPVSTRIAEQ